MHGALAQLGARNIRIVEAVGSNPICSMDGERPEAPESLADPVLSGYLFVLLFSH